MIVIRPSSVTAPDEVARPTRIHTSRPHATGSRIPTAKGVAIARSIGKARTMATKAAAAPTVIAATIAISSGGGSADPDRDRVAASVVTAGWGSGGVRRP